MFSTKNLFIQDNPTTNSGGLLLPKSLAHCIYTTMQLREDLLSAAAHPRIYLQNHTAK